VVFYLKGKKRRKRWGGGGRGGGGGVRWSAFFSSGLATSLALETWPVEHRMFVYDAFVESGESEESEET